MEALVKKIDTASKKKGTDKSETVVEKKKGKGTGKSSSAKSRTAADIRSESTSEQQKARAKKRKAEEAELDEELAGDPDMPTRKEREAALAALAAKGHTKGGVLIH